MSDCFSYLSQNKKHGPISKYVFEALTVEWSFSFDVCSNSLVWWSGLLRHVVSCWPAHVISAAPYWKTGNTVLRCLTCFTCLSEDVSGLIYNALMDRATGKPVSWWRSTRAFPFILAGYQLTVDRAMIQLLDSCQQNSGNQSFCRPLGKTT